MNLMFVNCTAVLLDHIIKQIIVLKKSTSLPGFKVGEAFSQALTRFAKISLSQQGKCSRGPSPHTPRIGT